MAVGTGFSQLLRGLGQVGGLAISSALFQSVLKRELSERIRGDEAQEVSGITFPALPLLKNRNTNVDTNACCSSDNLQNPTRVLNDPRPPSSAPTSSQRRVCRGPT